MICLKKRLIKQTVVCGFIILLPVFVSLDAEQTTAASKMSSGPSWLTGDTEHKLEQLANHHRCFDMAMVETNYRYTELFFSGQDQNWDYARYQAEKIKLAIENGFERRPKRKETAKALFLNSVYPQLIEAIESKDSNRFNKVFPSVTASCNQCHQAEQVGFIKIHEPKIRIAP